MTVFDRSATRIPRPPDGRLAAIMDKAGAEYLVMAGYMRKLHPVVLDAFPDRVLNLHPALIAFLQGRHAIKMHGMPV